MKLTEQDVQVHEKALNVFAEIEKKFNDRIEDVIRLVHKCFGVKFRNYYYEDAQEGKLGTLSPYYLYDRDQWFWLVYEDNADEMSLDAVSYDCEIPTAFLFMDDEEIVAQIKSEIEKDKIDKEKKKAKGEAKRKEKAELVKSAVKKLTSAERKTLGLKG